MKSALLAIHLIAALSLITLILMQSGKGGLGRAFGGDVVYRSKRGAEKFVFTATFIVTVIFFFTAIANSIVK